MDLPKFLLFLLLFLFSALLFPSLNTSINGISGSEALKPVFTLVLYLFPLSLIVATLYFAFEEK